MLLISKIPHFESNSQLFLDCSSLYSCCYWYQRYLILKAIHNKISNTSYSFVLLLISKIPHFESNSQHMPKRIFNAMSCYWYQRYLILKAIHNVVGLRNRAGFVVTDIKDTSFWKQFTTVFRDQNKISRLLLISKIPHFESNSQHGGSRSSRVLGCYWYQRYLILKAIHNTDESKETIEEVVTDIKDTSFWKQFTTPC